MKTVIFFSGLLVLFSIAACNKKKNVPVADNEYYTCSMDPQVMEKKPGKCPICKMELTKITVNQDDQNRLKFSANQIKLANINVFIFYS